MDARVWLNGRLLAAAEAQVPFLTPALHYGVAVFEGIRCYAGARGPAVFRLPDHLRRLLESAHILGFQQVPYTAADLANATKETIRASGFDECYVRPLVYLAEGGWDLTIDGGRPHVGIAVWKWTAYLGLDAREQGVRANVSSFTRHHPNVMMTKAKIAGNYANSVLARSESRRLGFDEAIMLDPQGYVAECTGENLFIVKANRLFTTPAAAILEGITRDTVMVLARDFGYEVSEMPLSRDTLYTADEVFVCGTAAEVIGLREIDGRQIGAGRTGPVTRRLQDAYHAATIGRHPRSAEWLDPVIELGAQRSA
jgi:branched-chain amino acid aminotransferase